MLEEFLQNHWLSLLAGVWLFQQHLSNRRHHEAEIVRRTQVEERIKTLEAHQKTQDTGFTELREMVTKISNDLAQLIGWVKQNGRK